MTHVSVSFDVSFEPAAADLLTKLGCGGQVCVLSVEEQELLAELLEDPSKFIKLTARLGKGLLVNSEREAATRAGE